MNWFQFIILASCLISQLSMKTGKKKPSIYNPKNFRNTPELRGKALNKRKYLDFKGSIQNADEAKIVTLTCKPDMTAKAKDGQILYKKKVKENIRYFMIWETNPKNYVAVIDVRFKDTEKFGLSNVRWFLLKRTRRLPSSLLTALGNFNVQAVVTKSASKSFLTVYMVLHRCDQIPGSFHCANFVSMRDANNYRSVGGVFKFGKENPKCSEKKNNKGPSLLDSLTLAYRKDIGESFNREGFGVAEIILKEVKESEGRQISVQCKLEEKYVNDVRTVDGFYIFYQPLWMVPQARVLLAGLKKTTLWTSSYNIRMFPQFTPMLKAKKASGFLGEAYESEFTVNIPLDECDALAGNFQCAMVTTKVTGKAKHPEHKDMTVESEMVRAVYKLQRTAVSKPTKKCKRNPKSDASISLTAERVEKGQPANATWSSVGINVKPTVHWMMVAAISVMIIYHGTKI